MFNFAALHSQKSNRWHLLAVWMLGISVFLVGLHQAPVPTVDGAVRASEARHIVETGKWFPIVYQGKEVSDHPPLFIWMTAASMKIFGVNDFAANLPQRLAAMLVVLLVALIALEIGFSPGIAFAAALILCMTRDFVLSSVRGYIEPLLELWIYGALWLVFRQRFRKTLLSSAIAGLGVWLAFFTKGPPALWPFIALTILLVWKGGLPGYRLRVFGAYAGAILVCTGIWALWVDRTGTWEYWRLYWDKQVLSSAMEGRGGAQSLEPLFYAKILLTYYWPWLPIGLWGAWRSIRWFWAFQFFDEAIYSWIFGIFGLGFLFGFSLVKWKFWYYIAPAYPAFALFIALSFSRISTRLLGKERVAKYAVAAFGVWILIGSIYPIKLFKERAQEVMDFKTTITQSGTSGPVWFVKSSLDHNKVGTSGEWYFHKPVTKVTDEEKWQAVELSAPAWVMTDINYWLECRNKVVWCSKGQIVQRSGETALILYK